MLEIDTILIQFSNLNHFQTLIILNLTHCIVNEGMITYFQFFQSLTILQIEATIWISIVKIPCETILSNLHSL